ncbi:NEDD8-conjugating enzyme Ubc12-like [Rutidosis leptorrhynchoides]|uniref:NEDD8-conjugating enzyme Ubc12-like n=1 Tax=Rutidosis leptorrhynchoides TaxID=125765 RepID=UPI003A998E66
MVQCDSVTIENINKWNEGMNMPKLKEKQWELSESSKGKPSSKKKSAGELRLHKDISELNLPNTCSIWFPNGKDDLMHFEVTIRPDEGNYLGGSFTFMFEISPIYPHEAPKVRCNKKVDHPNMDSNGNVCLKILREDWKPVLNINTIICVLDHLLVEPNREDFVKALPKRRRLFKSRFHPPPMTY